MIFDSIKHIMGQNKNQNIGNGNAICLLPPVEQPDSTCQNLSYNEPEATVVNSVLEYKAALKRGITEFDFSEFEIAGQSIEDVNFQNRNLTINLNQMPIPTKRVINRTKGFYELNDSFKELYIFLNNTNLQGNTVIGEPASFKTITNDYVYIFYSETTFDETYKKRHPKYFLSDETPTALKEKYYGYDTIMINKFHSYIKRKTLTFEEYMQYYEFLHDKYLGNLQISNTDLAKIRLIEIYGLAKANEILVKLSKSFIPIHKSLEIISHMTDEELQNISYNQSEVIKNDLALITQKRNQIRIRTN